MCSSGIGKGKGTGISYSMLDMCAGEGLEKRQAKEQTMQHRNDQRHSQNCNVTCGLNKTRDNLNPCQPLRFRTFGILIGLPYLLFPLPVVQKWVGGGGGGGEALGRERERG